MKIYPAIDLMQGKAVRLLHGDYQQMTVYSDDPVATALHFKQQGAAYLHLVDLEGAREGEPENQEVIARIIQATGMKAEVGGGIRDMQTIQDYLCLGAHRIILGTAALENTDFLHDAVDIYGEKIVVGVDVRDGFVAIQGWMETSDVRLDTFIQDLSALGISRIICTDISRDGAMQGTNQELYQELVERYPMHITASGGISTLSDVETLKNMGLRSIIIGKALYTGDIDLAAALLIAKGEGA